MAKEEVLDIRLRLKGEVKTRFLEIKNALGLTNDTEVLRVVISKYFEKNVAKGGSVALDRSKKGKGAA